MDFIIYNNENALILDAKWKELEINNEKLGVSQTDLYQLYNYASIIRSRRYTGF